MKRKKLPLIAIILAVCSVSVLVPVICSIIYFNTSVADRLEDTAKNTASFYLSQIANNTTTTLNTLHDCIYYLSSDKTAQKIMRDPENTTVNDCTNLEKGLNRAFFSHNQPNKNMVNGFYLVNDNYYFPVLQIGIYRGAEERIKHVYKTLHNSNSARDLYTIPEYPNYCYMIVDYINLDSMTPLGKIIIELDTNKFESSSSLNAIYNQAQVVLATTNGNSLSDSNPKFTSVIGTDTTYPKINGELYYHVKQILSPTHMELDLFIPYNEIIASSKQSIHVYILFAIVVLVLTISAGIWGMYLIYKPLRQMMHNLDRMATGDLSVRMEETPYIETEKMSQAFNNMADNLEELFDEVYEQGVLLRDAEFRLLESQIRPHFIFNVLELINMRCMEAGQNNICHMVTNLAQLLRANIRNKHQQTITFQEELQYVRYYLELQKERFGDNLHYSIDVEDPELLDYYLPKLTLQPLVENSVVHGLEPKRGGGTVQLSIWEEEDAVCFRVKDDGVGFDTEMIDFEQTQTSETHHNHVAVANIARRIQLLYGQEYGLHIQSKPGEGTEITVTLPINIQNDAQKE